MARAGRKTKQGYREPSGKRQRVYTDDVARLQTARQRKRYGLKGEALLDTRAGSVLGRALLRGHITQDQYAAGEEFARRWARWAAIAGIPAPTVQALDYTREVRGGGGGSGPSDDEVLSARRRYAELYGAGSPGLAAFNAVRSVVIEDGEDAVATESGRAALASALQGYVWIFGIAKRPAVV